MTDVGLGEDLFVEGNGELFGLCDIGCFGSLGEVFAVVEDTSPVEL